MKSEDKKDLTATPQETKAAFVPKEVSGLDIAFGPSKIGDLLPSMKDIPEEFHKHYNPFAEVVSRMFFSGGNIEGWIAKPGIDKKKALNHFRAVLGSFAPKHEHKTAGCAYMLSEWFQPESLGIQKGGAA